MNVAAILFYSGTLVSSIGSFTFNICLIAFMLKSGADLFHVSLILGLQRLVPILISGGLGHRTDQFSPKLTVVFAELGAAVASLGILWAWHLTNHGYLFLVAFCLLKTSVVSFQTGSKAKLTKLLSDASYASNSNHAIWFNKATQGATLFAGLCAWPIIKYLSFETAIWFDLLTFAINGAVVWGIEFKDEAASVVGFVKQTILSKFSDLYRYNSRATVLDLLLAVCMMGTTSLTSRLAGDDQLWVAILIGGYGAAVWLSGFLETSSTFQPNPVALWVGLGASYACLGVFAAQGPITLAFALCKDIFYWLLFHRISSHIQMDTPQSVMGAVMSARVTQMVLVLASGELLVGAWSNLIPVVYDGAWRAMFCVAVAIALMMPKFQVVTKPGYAKL